MSQTKIYERSLPKYFLQLRHNLSGRFESFGQTSRPLTEPQHLLLLGGEVGVDLVDLGQALRPGVQLLGRDSAGVEAGLQREGGGPF